MTRIVDDPLPKKLITRSKKDDLCLLRFTTKPRLASKEIVLYMHTCT